MATNVNVSTRAAAQQRDRLRADTSSGVGGAARDAAIRGAVNNPNFPRGTMADNRTNQGTSKQTGGAVQVARTQNTGSATKQGVGGASGGKGDNRPRLAGRPDGEFENPGRPGQGRTSPADGSNRNRIETGALRMPGESNR